MSEIQVTVGSITFNSVFHAGQNFYLLRNTDELLNPPEPRNTDSPKQGQHGTNSSLSLYGPRIMPFEGEIYGTDPDERFTLQQALRQALSLPTDQDYAGEDGYFLVQITDEDGTPKQIYAKIADGPSFRRVGERLEQIREFRFALYAEDPYLYSQSLYSSTRSETVVGTNFSVIQGVSPSVPFSLIADTIPTAIAVNAGSVATPPILTINGPTTDPVVANETTGKSMDFTGLTLLTGETLTIDVAAATIVKTVSGVETDASGYLDTSVSNWIYLDPGTNNLTLIDSSPGSIAATLDTEWRDAWI